MLHKLFPQSTRALFAVIACGLSLSAPAALLASAAPVLADTPFTVSLTAQRPDGLPLLTQVIGEKLTLVATVNQDIESTPFWILIYDAESKNFLRGCPAGPTCTVDVVENVPQFHHFVAYVARFSTNKLDPQNDSPPSIQASSDADFNPSWLRPMTLTATRVPPSPSFCPPAHHCGNTGVGDAISLFADTGGAPIVYPWSVYFFNLDTGNVVGKCVGPSVFQGSGSVSGITTCNAIDHNSHAVNYWAVIAMNPYFGLPFQTSPANDLRDGSFHVSVPAL